jgi:hypothetical protein
MFTVVSRTAENLKPISRTPNDYSSYNLPAIRAKSRRRYSLQHSYVKNILFAEYSVSSVSTRPKDSPQNFVLS